MFKTRLFSSVVLVAIALVTVGLGGPVLATLLMVVSIIGMKEIYRIKGIEKHFLGIIGYIGTIVYYLLIFTNRQEYIMMMILILLVLFMAEYVFTFPKYEANQVMLAFFGFFYVTVMLSYVYQTRALENGLYAVWFIFISSWICDTCAYCVGIKIGKHKMAPVLSPKKSIEGAIGGLAGAGLVGWIYGTCVVKFAGSDVNPLVFAVICVVGAMISMIGDLAASGIKRDNSVKDYGDLIPGHGGILDRFDSMIFTAPIIYFLAYYLI